MSKISAELVKQLRDKTGAGMMDCKKALEETGGDLEAAVDWLRTKGLLKAAKKADRVAAEGLVGVAVKADAKGAVAAAVEVNSETDFVARNATFQAFVREAAQLAVPAGGNVETLLAAKMASGKTLGDQLTELIATIGENLVLRRVAGLTVAPGVVTSYVHASASEGLGRIGVLVALKSEGDKAKLGELGRNIALHVAAAAPLALKPEELDPLVVERERAVLLEQARASGKPDGVIEKMVEGGLRKFYEQSVLLNQLYVMDNKTPVAKVVQDAAASVGAPVELTGFVRFGLGEGVEKKTVDFAAEVAAAVKG